ncbi:MAG: Hpt domain-containing protein, partial [Bradyrhizobium sp.]|nr:Hpt domain-containing protein [Bradyrhizobium sp.]
MDKQKPKTVEIKSYATHHVITQPNPPQHLAQRIGLGDDVVG